MYNRVLITGAGGALGQVLRDGLKGVYPVLRLSHRRDIGPAQPGEEINVANLESFEEVDAAMEGVDAVVHLGGKAVEGTWDEILHSNIIGTYNLFETARRHKVKRVVFASTHHIVGYYRRDRVVGVDAPPRPDSRYAVSKVFGEALGRMYADKYGMSVVSQRIGVSQKEVPHVRGLWTWQSYPDYVHMTRQCLDTPDIHFLVAYGVSANTRPLWDNSTAEAIGYEPQDDAEDHIREVLAKQKFEDEPMPERLFHGGWFTGMEFEGDVDKID